jgi:hypothetical protein
MQTSTGGVAVYMSSRTLSDQTVRAILRRRDRPLAKDSTAFVARSNVGLSGLLHRTQLATRLSHRATPGARFMALRLDEALEALHIALHAT